MARCSGSFRGTTGGRSCRQYEIDLRLGRTLGEVGEIEMGDAGEISADHVWSAPVEVRNLVAPTAQTLSWSAPASLGGTSVLYDSIRSQAAVDFGASAVCVESNDGLDTQAT